MRLDASEPPDRSRLFSLRDTLAHLLMGQQQWERARELMLEELIERRRRGDRRAEAAACAQLGRVENYAGAYADAQSWFEQSIAIAQARGDHFLVQSALIHLAVAKMGQGDYVGARSATGERRNPARAGQPGGRAALTDGPGADRAAGGRGERGACVLLGGRAALSRPGRRAALPLVDARRGRRHGGRRGPLGACGAAVRGRGGGTRRRWRRRRAGADGSEGARPGAGAGGAGPVVRGGMVRGPCDDAGPGRRLRAGRRQRQRVRLRAQLTTWAAQSFTFQAGSRRPGEQMTGRTRPGTSFAPTDADG
jgi:hypothetical protein